MLGLHILGPHAGEVIQGFSLAMRLGFTLGDLQRTVGVHPTHAEEVVGLSRSKRSGVDVSGVLRLRGSVRASSRPVPRHITVREDLVLRLSHSRGHALAAGCALTPSSGDNGPVAPCDSAH